MDSKESFEPLKLLSLDGGGVRGLASLLILDNLMRRINHEVPPRPCEYFDLIGGTSTGGLIAIMLGPLGMDVQSCIKAYVELSQKVFKKRRWRTITRTLWAKGRFDSAELEKAILKIIRDQGKDEDTMLFDQANPRPRCRVFVCVTRKANSTNTCFRSYESHRGHNRNCKLWEAARATSAAPTFFDPITIGPYGEEYVDGATGRNNPVSEVLEEARDIWPKRKIQCFISIGTGIPDFKAFGENLVGILETLKNIATETERTAEAFLKTHRELKENNIYFRFNVATGLQKIRLDESEKIGEMAQATDTYLESEGVRIEMEKCVRSLRDSSSLTEQQKKLGEQETDTEKIDLEFKDNFENIRSWLSPPSYDSDYLNIKAQRAPTTCKWILERDEFKAWNDGSSQYLWVHGKPGCGKSVIASTVVEDLKIAGEGCSKCGESRQRHLGYVFCDKKNETKRSCLSVMKVLVWQVVSRDDLLATQKKTILTTWRAAPDPQALSNSRPIDVHHSAALLEFFERLITPYNSCQIVLDGLDECERPGSLLDWLLSLTTNSPLVRLLFFSQNVSSITDQYLRDPKKSIIEITPESTIADIAKYVDTRLPGILDPGTPMHSEIRRTLLGKSEGMFLWVKLAMGRLETVSKSYSMDSRLLEIVEAFPKGLDELFTYILERTLKDNEAYQEFEEDNAFIKRDICRVLEFVLWSFRPLAVEELQFALKLSTPETMITAMGESIDSVAKFKKQVLSLCSPLLHFHKDDTVIIVHSTFLNFMETKLRQTPDFQGFSQPVVVHRKLATACLRYLQLQNFSSFIGLNILPYCLQAILYPFKDYATRYWWSHLDQQYPPGEVCGFQQVHQKAADFIKSDQAITWLESSIEVRGISRWASDNTKYFLSAVQRCVGGKEWAVPLLRKALAERTSQLGELHSDTLQAQNNLFSVYFLQNSFKQAQELGLQLIEVRTRIFGEEDPHTLSAMGNLGAVYGRQDECLEKAEELGLRLVEVQKRISGEEHLDTLNTMHNLSVVYYDQGRFIEAQTLGLHLIEVGVRVFSEAHPFTMGCISNLAKVYSHQGRWREAEELALKLVKMQKRIFGEKDLATVRAMSNLATIYEGQGRLKEAEELVLQALKIRERMLGAEHPDTLVTMSCLAVVYLHQERLKEAETLGLQALEVWRRIPDWERPDNLNVMGILASVYQEQGRYNESEALILQVLEYRRRISGEEHIITLWAMGDLALVYYHQGRFEEAEKLGLQVLGAQEKKYERETQDTLTTMGTLALVYQGQGHLDKAEALGLKVLNGRRKLLGEGHPITLKTMRYLAAGYIRLGRLMEAEEFNAQIARISSLATI